MTSTRKSSSSSFPLFAALSAQQKPNSSPDNASVAFVAFVALVAAALISDYVRAEQFVFGFPPELEKNSERSIIIEDTSNWERMTNQLIDNRPEEKYTNEGV